MESWKRMTLIFGIATMAHACAHQTLDRRVDQEASQENSVKNRNDLTNEASHLIATTPGLSDAQRSHLRDLRDRTTQQINEVTTQSLQLRSLLIKSLLSSRYNPDEVEVIKRKIKKEEEQRLAIMFNAVEEAVGIMGHETSAERQKMMMDYLQQEEFRQ